VVQVCQLTEADLNLDNNAGSGLPSIILPEVQQLLHQYEDIFLL
jgi:hypothetical protein